jgi:hypothetical protein
MASSPTVGALVRVHNKKIIVHEKLEKLEKNKYRDTGNANMRRYVFCAFCGQ